ncbi:hypothetical protein R1flu_002041 [Riccia fluitans]|uniref:Uncharacterized protein n=1 Tax=Riccia fluitans TaxID=41844 RepID=A0ABD1Y509_9MARC
MVGSSQFTTRPRCNDGYEPEGAVWEEVSNGPVITVIDRLMPSMQKGSGKNCDKTRGSASSTVPTSVRYLEYGILSSTDAAGQCHNMWCQQTAFFRHVSIVKIE